MIRTLYITLAAFGAIFLAAACIAQGDIKETRRQSAQAVSGGEPASEVSFILDDSTITGPDSAMAGWVRILTVNNGQNDNNLALLQLLEGKTTADLATHLQQSTGPLPAWATPAGGQGDVAPGASGNVTLNLEAGSYAIVRYVTDATGVSRPAASPVLPFTLSVGESTGLEPVPSAIIRITATGYASSPIGKARAGFVASEALKAGFSIIKIVNESPIAQEVKIIDLEGFKSPGEYEGWAITSPTGGYRITDRASSKLRPVFGDDGVGPTAPPPGTAIGGVMAILPGKIAYMSVDLTMGYLVLYSSLLDPESGKPYFLLGELVQDLEVRR
jgi:hypothetical protein